MLPVLQFYVSSFWVWLGITIGLSILVRGAYRSIVGAVAAARGTPVHFGDINYSTDEK